MGTYSSNLAPGTAVSAQQPRCPWGYRWDPVKKACADQVAGVDRLMGPAPTAMPDMRMMNPVQAAPALSDATSVGIGVFGVVMWVVGVAGTIGGITYMVKENPFKLSFLKHKRRK